MGDLILTAGHALLQVTAPGTPDDPWTAPGTGAPSGKTIPPPPRGLPKADEFQDQARKLKKAPPQAAKAADPTPSQAAAANLNHVPADAPAKTHLAGPAKSTDPDFQKMIDTMNAMAQADADDAVHPPDDQGEEDIRQAMARLQAERDRQKAAEEAARLKAEQAEQRRLARQAAKTAEQIEAERRADDERIRKAQAAGDMLDQIRRAREERERNKAAVQAAQDKRAAELKARQEAQAQAEAAKHQAAKDEQRRKLQEVADRLKAKNQEAAKSNENDGDDGWD
jgi:hypothetical protein